MLLSTKPFVQMEYKRFTSYKSEGYILIVKAFGRHCCNLLEISNKKQTQVPTIPRTNETNEVGLLTAQCLQSWDPATPEELPASDGRISGGLLVNSLTWRNTTQPLFHASFLWARANLQVEPDTFWLPLNVWSIIPHIFASVHLVRCNSEVQTSFGCYF